MDPRLRSDVDVDAGGSISDFWGAEWTENRREGGNPLLVVEGILAADDKRSVRRCMGSTELVSVPVGEDGESVGIDSSDRGDLATAVRETSDPVAEVRLLLLANLARNAMMLTLSGVPPRIW
jgi:hypothetical protein